MPRPDPTTPEFTGDDTPTQYLTHRGDLPDIHPQPTPRHTREQTAALHTARQPARPIHEHRDLLHRVLNGLRRL